MKQDCSGIGAESVGKKCVLLWIGYGYSPEVDL